jgi:tetratricopeptide (TPR) repeat protein
MPNQREKSAMPTFDDDEEYWDEDPLEDEDEEEEDDVEDHTAIVEQADELADVGEFRKAIRLWRRSIERFSDEPEAQFAYGRTVFRLLEEEIVTEKWWVSDAELVSLYEECLAALEEAVSIDDQFLPSWNLMGTLFALRQNYESAISCWQKSLEIDDDQPQVRIDLEEAQERS